MTPEQTFSVSDFVAVFNQTISYAYPNVSIQGELANFRVSKNRWAYFDLKDELASVKFFGTVYNLPGPLEEGMVLKVVGAPQLHSQYGFSINVHSIQLAGEGTIKKAAQLLQAQLEKEGLFDPARKRVLPYPPASVGLITSGESAAYSDFIKVIKARWGGISIMHFDVQVQGEESPAQIVQAIDHFNSHASPVDALIITRGGGSADDLQAFSTESVTRAVAASRIPTLVAVGHERDVSLAELAADQRASTPSNAAELLVPDKKSERASLRETALQCGNLLNQSLGQVRLLAEDTKRLLSQQLDLYFDNQFSYLKNQSDILALASPSHILERGYAVVRKNGKNVRSISQVKRGDMIEIQVGDGEFTARKEGEV